MVWSHFGIPLFPLVCELLRALALRTLCSILRSNFGPIEVDLHLNFFWNMGLCLIPRVAVLLEADVNVDCTIAAFASAGNS
jgi:hypothetical protein